MRRLPLFLSLLVLAACGGSEENAATPAADSDVESLDNILALRSDFEADAGTTRVILLFSPT